MQSPPKKMTSAQSTTKALISRLSPLHARVSSDDDVAARASPLLSPLDAQTKKKGARVYGRARPALQLIEDEVVEDIRPAKKAAGSGTRRATPGKKDTGAAAKPSESTKRKHEGDDERAIPGGFWPPTAPAKKGKKKGGK